MRPVLLAAAAFSLLSTACTIGDTAASTATLVVADTEAVADGVSSVTVTVTGDANSRITLVVDGAGAGFVDPDSGVPAEKSVYLLDNGVATAEVVSTVDGQIAVAIKGERSRTTQYIPFLPLRIAAGEPMPVSFAPGRTVHDVCFAVNSATGFLVPSNFVFDGLGSIGGSTTVEDEIPSGAGCPAQAAEDAQAVGWVMLQWGTSTGAASVTVNYLAESDDGASELDAGSFASDAGNGDGGDEPDAGTDDFPKAAPLASERFVLMGDAFPGYDVVAGEPDFGDSFISLDIAVTYRDGGDPASGVLIEEIGYATGAGPTFLGASSGTPVETGPDGTVILFFAYDAEADTYALCLTPEGGTAVCTDFVVEDVGGGEDL
jgi:hypothetical protein